MRVTEKGQVTIPKPIRDRLGIGPGSEVEFVARDGIVELVAGDDERAAFDRLARLSEHLQKIGGSLDLGMTAEQYMEELRGPYDDVDPR